MTRSTRVNPAFVPSFLAQIRTEIVQDGAPYLDNFQKVMLEAIQALEQKKLVFHIPAPATSRHGPSGMHYHATPEIFIQRSGCTQFMVQDGEFELRAGEICLMPRGVPHREWAKVMPSDVYCATIAQCHPYSYNLVYNKTTTTSYGSWQTIQRFAPGKLACFTEVLDELAGLRSEAQCGTETEHYRTYTDALIMVALLWIQRLISASSLVKKQYSGNYPLISRSFEVIEARLADPSLNVQVIAKTLGCTPDYLSRIVRRHTGRSVLDHIHTGRVAKAQDLLSYSQKTIGEIAWECGFATQSYFNKVFRLLTGETPNSFRRSHFKSDIFPATG